MSLCWSYTFNQVACSYALLIGLKFFGRERDMLAGNMNWTSLLSLEFPTLCILSEFPMTFSGDDKYTVLFWWGYGGVVSHAPILGETCPCNLHHDKQDTGMTRSAILVCFLPLLLSPYFLPSSPLPLSSFIPPPLLPSSSLPSSLLWVMVCVCSYTKVLSSHQRQVILDRVDFVVVVPLAVHSRKVPNTSVRSQNYWNSE